MADKVSIDFLANDANLSKSMDKQVRDTVRAQNANESRAKQSRKAAADEVSGWKSVQSEIDAVIRKMQDLKRARGELIAGAPNWTNSSRGGGPIGPFRGVNFQMPGSGWTRGPGGTWVGPAMPSGGGGALPPPPIAGYLGYSGGRSGGGGAMDDAVANGVNTFVKGALQTAAGFLTLQTAIKAVNEQLELQVRVQNAAADAHVGLAHGHAIIALNTFGQTEKEREKLRSAARGISTRTGMPEELVADMLGEQAGRGANLSLDQIIQAGDVAAQLTKHTHEQFKPTAAGIQQIMRIGNVDATKAASLFQSAAAAAYPGNPELQARMIQQSIAVAIANSPVQDLQTVEEIAEYTSAASQVGGEERGEATRTAMAALMAQVNEFRTGTGPWMLHGKGGRQMANPIPGIPDHPRAALEHIMRDPVLSEMFWNKATFERQYEGPLRDMLTNPKGRGGQILAETQKLVGVNEPGLEEQIKAIDHGSRQLEVATEAQKTEVAKQQAAARMTVEALQKEALGMVNSGDKPSVYDQTSKYSNIPQIINRSALGLNRLFNAPESVALSALEQRRAEIYHKAGFAEYGQRPPDSALSESQRNDLHLVERSITRLEEIRDEIKKLREEKPVPTAGPAANAEVGRSRER